MLPPLSRFGGTATRSIYRTTLRNLRLGDERQRCRHRRSATRSVDRPMHRVVIRTPSIPAAVRVLATASLVQSGADSVSSRRAVALRSGDAAVAGAAPARSMLGFDPMPCHADLHHQRADSHRHDARQNEMKFIHAKPPPWPASPKSSPRRVRKFDHRGLQGNPARPASGVSPRIGAEVGRDERARHGRARPRRSSG